MPACDPDHVEVRLYGDLDWFCEVDAATGAVLVPYGAARSVKDLVESIGVPHTEVGALLVDGTTVGFDHLVPPGARVTVYPPMHDLAPSAQLTAPPPRPVAFVADVHLGTLARRLRLLGFDTWYDTHADDAALAQRAVDQGRVLLTRDRHLLMRRIVTHGYCPRSSDPDEQLTEVVRRYGLTDHARPFTRCANCNGMLVPVDKHDVLDELPPRTRTEHDQFARCSDCGQVYWPGSHVDAINDLLGDHLPEGA